MFWFGGKGALVGGGPSLLLQRFRFNLEWQKQPSISDFMFTLDGILTTLRER